MPQNELNLESLDEIFQSADEAEEKTIDFKTDIEYDDAVEALKTNIYNANQLLERVQHEMNNGNFSARLVEVTGTIINSITQASKEVIQDKNYGEYLLIRKALVQLKAKEIEIKEAKMSVPRNQTNVLVTSREDLLKALNDKEPKELIEMKGEVKNE